MLHRYDWDWDAAEREYRRAIELDPNSHAWGVALFLWSAGRYEDAIVWYKRAEERNPLSILLKVQLGWTYVCAGQYDQAIEHLRNILELDPNSASARSGLAAAYLRKSMDEEAIAESQKVVALREGSPIHLARLGYAYAVAGRKVEALEILSQLERKNSGRFSTDFADLYVALGKKDEALAMLQRAFEERSDELLYIRCSALYNGLRDNPAFQEILRGINFPERDIQLETRQ